MLLLRQPTAASIAVFLALDSVWLGEGIHYICNNDEVNGEVQGETGSVCGPKCNEGTFDCPLDVPDGTSAQPQCVLQDVDLQAYCALLCQDDSQCPSGDSCRRIPSVTPGGPEVSLCVHPLSFAEWAKTGSRRKLSVGFPSRAAQSPNAKGFMIAKAYAALQSLKRKYAIQDGDADVLTVKELLSAASTPGMVRPAGPPPSTTPLPSSPLAAIGGITHAELAAQEAKSWLQPWEHDISNFAGYLKDGVPGLEREAHDIVWNAEHITDYGKSTEMLRGVIWIAVIYVLVGSVYRFQLMGARGWDVVPHRDFWEEYPILVLDGVRYAQILIGGITGKDLGGGVPFGGSSGGFQPIGSDKDTFAGSAF
eukprot:TRINITY_DN18549_c0_g1_i1.p1 TRINITY_DN18549_c0_g1~~TRINITY_DN18549_c0_g1_i1.p1  ORF type:complete len:365 (-),score=82.24 TRINITY_DN18549_c0_g1_i1:120-1214(-)